MTSYLLDTDVLSEVVKPRPSPLVTSFLSAEGDLWLNVITLHEFSYGLARIKDDRRQMKLATFIASVKNQFKDRIIAIDEAIGETAGRLRAFSDSRGRVLSPLDSLIAATAMTHGMTLVTHNAKDFEKLDMPLIDPWSDRQHVPR